MNIALNGQNKHGHINKGKEIRDRYKKLQGLHVLYKVDVIILSTETRNERIIIPGFIL